MLVNTFDSTFILGNETSPEEARKKHGPDIVFTGKENVTKLQVYTQWYGMAVVEDAYAYCPQNPLRFIHTVC